MEKQQILKEMFLCLTSLWPNGYNGYYTDKERAVRKNLQFKEALEAYLKNEPGAYRRLRPFVDAGSRERFQLALTNLRKLIDPIQVDDFVQEFINYVHQQYDEWLRLEDERARVEGVFGEADLEYEKELSRRLT